MASLCGLEHLYDDRRCILPAGHEYAPTWTPHQSADGFRWERHEETYAEGTENEGVEQWDEPVDYEPGPRAVLLDDTGVLIREHTFDPPVVVEAGSSVELTWTITIS